ncbi:MAG TPA: hypothetical protein VGL77_16775 [Armatimonadota bacterium]|jgi:hypothetical protein
MIDVPKTTCCSCGVNVACDTSGPVEPGHNDELDLQFMLSVLQIAHDLVADPASGWRKTYPNVQGLRKYVKCFVAEQLRSHGTGEPADPTLDKPTVEESLGVQNTSCAVCRSNYYACMQQVPQPPDCADNYAACVNQPCIP